MPDLLFFDYETRARVDLRKTGLYRYTEDPEHSVLMVGYALNDEPVQVAEGPEACRAVMLDYLLDEDVRLVAHNAAFERIVTSRLIGMRSGEYLPPERFVDTQALAGVHGYPQTLAGLAKALGVAEKDTAGSALIRFFCVPRRDGGWNSPEGNPEKWEAFVRYCAIDVEALRQAFHKLKGFPNALEREVHYVDQRINDRGVRIDGALAEKATLAVEDNRMGQELEIQSLTGVLNPGSQPQMLRWFQGSGLEIDNLQAETIEDVLETAELDVLQRRVLELHQEIAGAATKKFPAALESVCEDGRIRGSFKYFGAHTGRWSGRGVQVQNLPRAGFSDGIDKALPEDVQVLLADVARDLAIDDLMRDEGADADTLKALVRALFVGPFTIVDYAAIEARVIAWLAGETWALEAFYAGRDIYTETGARMGGLTRAQGKVAVLALGYQGGINSLRAMGAEGTDAELQDLVTQWRKANARIVRLWRTMSEAIADPGQVGPHLRTSRTGETLRLHLPSGRSIAYHGLRHERYRVKDPKTKKILAKEGWRYDNPKRAGARIGTYGGRWIENATQAVARDIMAEALVRLERAGYQAVAHVHDEILVEGEHDVEEISRIMCIPPSWAEGLPIDGAGFVTNRYRKG